VAEPLDLFKIAFLEPISRGVHLAGPRLHAERLVKIWHTEEAVRLEQAFRLLDVSLVESVIWRTMNEISEFGDECHWQFPEFEQLLPPLCDQVWQETLNGRLTIEGTTADGKRHGLLPAKLQFLKPDWPTSRLHSEGHLKYVEVTVKRPAVSVSPSPRKVVSDAELGRCIQQIVTDWANPTEDIKRVVKDWKADKQPEESELLELVRTRLDARISRKRLRLVMKNHAPQWVRERGRPRKK
jgi:hypothetical protein